MKGTVYLQRGDLVIIQLRNPGIEQKDFDTLSEIINDALEGRGLHIIVASDKMDIVTVRSPPKLEGDEPDEIEAEPPVEDKPVVKHEPEVIMAVPVAERN